MLDGISDAGLLALIGLGGGIVLGLADAVLATIFDPPGGAVGDRGVQCGAEVAAAEFHGGSVQGDAAQGQCGKHGQADSIEL